MRRRLPDWMNFCKKRFDIIILAALHKREAILEVKPKYTISLILSYLKTYRVSIIFIPFVINLFIGHQNSDE